MVNTNNDTDNFKEVINPDGINTLFGMEIDNPEEFFNKQNNLEDSTDDDLDDVSKTNNKSDTNKPIIKLGNPDLDDNDSNDKDGLGEYEEELVGFLNDKLSEKLELTLNDDNKPKTIDEVIGLLSDIVEENSKPSFASDEVAMINEFVSNGGKITDYYKNLVVDRLSIDTIDIDEESHQKSILKEDLRNKGLTDLQIDKKLKRWEDAGVLYDEAEEALESVKEYRKKTEEKLLTDQKNQKLEYEKAQQTFFTSVDKIIKETADIQGVPVSDKTKKELVEYIFRPESDGYSKFYKETGLVITHNTNPKYLLETAYFAKNGSTLVNKIEKKVESNAAKILKERLATKGTRGINQSSNYGSANLLASLGSRLLPK